MAGQAGSRRVDPPPRPTRVRCGALARNQGGWVDPAPHSTAHTGESEEPPRPQRGPPGKSPGKSAACLRWLLAFVVLALQGISHGPAWTRTRDLPIMSRQL
jgi:hypothetical protein